MSHDLSPFGMTSHSHTLGWAAIVFTFDSHSTSVNVTLNMDIEYDSDLEGVPEFEISQEGEIRPYMFEPMRRSASGGDSESDREDDSGSLSSACLTSDDDDADFIPDVSSW